MNRKNKKTNENRTLFSALVVCVNVLISKFSGLLRDIMLANCMGAGIIADAYWTAIRLPNTFRRIFAEGAFSNAFVPFFVKYVNNNKECAQMFASRVLLCLSVLLIITTIIFELFMPQVISLINPGFVKTPERFELTVILSRICFPYLICISIASLYGAILNSINSFWQYASLSTMMNIIFIISALLLGNTFENIGVCLSWTFIFIGIVQVIFLVISCHRKNIAPSLSPKVIKNGEKTVCDALKKDEELKSFLKKFLPATISNGVLQINIFIDGIFASFFVGGITYMHYSDRLSQLSLSLIGYSLSIALLPTLSLAFISKQFEKIGNLQTQAINVAMFFAIPSTCLFTTLAEPIIELFFQHGSFTSADTEIVSKMLIIISFSIPFSIIQKILFACFYANKNTRSPMKICVCSLAINLLLDILIIKIVGIYCVAISTTASAVVSTIFGVYLLKKDGQYFANSKKIVSFIGRVLIISLISCVAIPLEMMGQINIVANSIFLILPSSGLMYVVMCWIGLFDKKEKKIIVEKILKILRFK